MDMPLFWEDLARVTCRPWKEVEWLWLALSAPCSPCAPLYFSADTGNWSVMMRVCCDKSVLSLALSQMKPLSDWYCIRPTRSEASSVRDTTSTSSGARHNAEESDMCHQWYD
eukprot:1153610-Pelagomonas_calceolata.AAC.2